VSTIVRRLSDTDDIAFATGTGGVDSITFGTFAILFKPLVAYTGIIRDLVRLRDAADVDLGGIGIAADDAVYWQPSTTGPVYGPVTTPGEWHLLVARYAGGTSRAWFSLLNLATGIWSHSDSDFSATAWTAPTGGSVHMNWMVNGPGSDVAVMALWANELPWAANSSSDSEIEGAGLEAHLDNWRALEPSAGWAFSQPSTAYNVEDFTLGRADQINADGGTVVAASDLDFIYADSGIEITSRNHLRDTETEPGTGGGSVWDLSETQGTPTTLGSGNVASGSYIEVMRWLRVVGATVGSTAIDTQVRVTAVSASTLQYRWRVQRIDSSDVVQASSDYSSDQNTVGIKVASFILDTTWAAGDRLALSLELRKASGGGNRSITVAVNDGDSWAEFTVADVSPANVTAAIPLSLALAGVAGADHAVAAAVPLGLALAPVADAPAAGPAEAAAGVDLALALAPVASAPEVEAANVTAGIALALAVTPATTAPPVGAAGATSTVPLALTLAPVVSAPAGVTASVALAVTVAGVAQASRQVTVEIPLGLAMTSATTTAQHRAGASVPLALAVASTVVAPEVGAPGQVTATIPLSLAVAGTAAASHEANAGLALTLAVAPATTAPEIVTPGEAAAAFPLGLSLSGGTATGYQAAAALPLTVTIGATGRTDHTVVCAMPLVLAVAAAALATDPNRRGFSSAVAQRVPTSGGVA
jgi:hypothetical protein